jgi:hypothetical protein
MSSPTWTPDALRSEARAADGSCWRLVEAQHIASTMKLVDNPHEQEMLERLIDETKPAVPPECRHLNYLLFTPFRYRPYPHGSRFRRAGWAPGVFYASAAETTAVAEMAFYRLLFFLESPATPWPVDPPHFHAFEVRYAVQRMLDLTRPPLSADRAAWESPSDYGACQALADTARSAGVAAIAYRSVRDPDGGRNVALLTCRAFSEPQPVAMRSWRLRLGAAGVQALREMPRDVLYFDPSAFAADPRIAGLRWAR